MKTVTMTNFGLYIHKYTTVTNSDNTKTITGISSSGTRVDAVGGAIYNYNAVVNISEGANIVNNTACNVKYVAVKEGEQLPEDLVDVFSAYDNKVTGFAPKPATEQEKQQGIASYRRLTVAEYKAIYNSILSGDTETAEEHLTYNGSCFAGGIYITRNDDYHNGDGLTPPFAGSLTMTGGKIQYNQANSGGAINVAGYLFISGGEISYNKALTGGGIYMADYTVLHFSGKPVINNNSSTLDDETHVTANDLQVPADKIPNTNPEEYEPRILHIDDAFEVGAYISVWVNTKVWQSGKPFTSGYGEHNRQFVTFDGSDKPNADESNGMWVYANPYRYFVSKEVYDPDNWESKVQQHIVVLANGELGMTMSDVTFTVKFSDDSEETFTFGKAYSEAEQAQMPIWNYLPWTYGSDKYPVSISAFDATTGQIKTKDVDNKSGKYTLSVTPDSNSKTATEFSVIIQPKKLSDEDVVIEIELPEGGYNYEKDVAREPKFTIELVKAINESTALTEDDYTIEYRDNVNAGKSAYILFTFKGNFYGTAKGYFTIGPAVGDEFRTHVVWEVLVDGEWVVYDKDEHAQLFIYDGTNHQDKIRVKLTFQEFDEDPVVQAAYAQGVYVPDNESDVEQNTSMYITFAKGTGKADFVNAGEYTLNLEGDGNYPLEDEEKDRVLTVSILPQTISLSAKDFANYLDADGNQLWLLHVGEQNITLLDSVTYLLISGDSEEVIKGSKQGGFARFRDVEMGLVVNENYKLADGKTIADILKVAEKADPVNNGDTKGEHGKVSEVTTTFTFTFNSNYYVNSTNTITISWTWKIVTISNTLRTNTGSDVIGSELDGWQFRDPMGIKTYLYRAEHGNTVFYAYYVKGETKPFMQFAIVYSNDTMNARRNFYNVVVADDGTLSVGTELLNPTTLTTTQDSYLIDFLFGLKAGDYIMTVTIPALEPSSEEHTHW